MKDSLSTWQQLAIHFGALGRTIRLGKIRPVHVTRAMSGIFRAVAHI